MKQKLLACKACGGIEFYQTRVNEGYIKNGNSFVGGFTHWVGERSRVCATCGKKLVNKSDFEMSEKMIELTEDEAKAMKDHERHNEKYIKSRASAEAG